MRGREGEVVEMAASRSPRLLLGSSRDRLERRGGEEVGAV